MNVTFQNTYYVQVRRPNQRNSEIEAVKCGKLMHVSTARQAKGRQNKFGGDTRLSRSRSWRSPTTDAHRRSCSGFNVGRSRLQLRPKPVCGRVCQRLPTDRWPSEQRVSTGQQHVSFRDDHARKMSQRESLLLITRRKYPTISREKPRRSSPLLSLQIKRLIIREVVLARELFPARPMPPLGEMPDDLLTSFCRVAAASVRQDL